MDYILLISIALSLSVDSFMVSLGIGASLCKGDRRGRSGWLALCVGLAHSLFTYLGTLLSRGLLLYISSYSRWLGFILLSLLGLKMIYDGFSDSPRRSNSLSVGSIAYISVAVSVDALVAGGAIEALVWGVNELVIIAMVGFMAALSVVLGLFIGVNLKRSGSLWTSVIGGVVLLGVALKSLFIE